MKPADFFEGLAAVAGTATSIAEASSSSRRFDAAYPFAGPVACVKEAGEMRYIDREGRIVWKP